MNVKSKNTIWNIVRLGDRGSKQFDENVKWWKVVIFYDDKDNDDDDGGSCGRSTKNANILASSSTHSTSLTKSFSVGFIFLFVFVSMLYFYHICNCMIVSFVYASSEHKYANILSS